MVASLPGRSYAPMWCPMGSAWDNLSQTNSTNPLASTELWLSKIITEATLPATRIDGEVFFMCDILASTAFQVRPSYGWCSSVRQERQPSIFCKATSFVCLMTILTYWKLRKRKWSSKTFRSRRMLSPQHSFSRGVGPLGKDVEAAVVE